MLLPVGMCFFPGLLVSQDASNRVPFYQKEFGSLERSGSGGEGRGKTAASKTGAAKSSQDVPASSQASIDFTGKSATTIRAKTSANGAKTNDATSSKERLKEKLDRLNQQYQEDLQSLLGSAEEASDTIVPVSNRRSSETEEGSRGVPRPLDPGFQAQDWPTLPAPGDAAPWETKKVSSSSSRANTYPNDRGASGSFSPATEDGDAYRGNGASRESIQQVQGVYPAASGNLSQPGAPRQTIKTAPAMSYADPNQGQPPPSRRANAPVQSLGTAPPPRTRSAPAPAAVDLDLPSKDLEMLRVRYLSELRALNRRYQDEAVQVMNGHSPGVAQQVHHQMEAATGTATHPRTAPYATTPVQKSGRYFDFFWLPRMFGYFRPTLPFARMNQDTVVSDQAGAPARAPATTHQPVKQTALFSGSSPQEQKKTITTRSPNRPGQSTATTGNGYSRGEAGQPAAGTYSYENGASNAANPRNAPANGNRAPVYRESVQEGTAPRMLPVQNRQGENAENGVRAAVNAPPASGAVNPGYEPERMPRGTVVPANDREKLQHSIDALHRKYQEDLKALLNTPAPVQELEDQVSVPRNRQEISGGANRGEIDSREPVLTQKEQLRRRSAEEFFELIQASHQATPPWARGEGNQKGGTKDGVAQMERPRGAGNSAGKPAPQESSDRGGR